MGRPKAADPVGERVVFYLTKSEKKTLDTLRAELFPRLSESKALREIIIEWSRDRRGNVGAMHQSGAWSGPAIQEEIPDEPISRAAENPPEPQSRRAGRAKR